MTRRKDQSEDYVDLMCGVAPPKVLIFDGDTADLNCEAEPFEAAGCEVHKCRSIETAMRSVEREEFNFALVDQGSAQFEGLRVIRHLVRYNIHTPFIVLAKHKDADCHLQALGLGAIDYLEKPVPTAEFELIIREYLGRSSKAA